MQIKSRTEIKSAFRTDSSRGEPASARYKREQAPSPRSGTLSATVYVAAGRPLSGCLEFVTIQKSEEPLRRVFTIGEVLLRIIYLVGLYPITAQKCGSHEL